MGGTPSLRVSLLGKHSLLGMFLTSTHGVSFCGTQSAYPNWLVFLTFNHNNKFNYEYCTWELKFH